MQRLEQHTPRFIAYIYSRHPLAVRTINGILQSAGITYSTLKFIPKGSISDPIGCKFLVLDVCSVSDWPESVSRWHAQTGQVLLLVPEDGSDKKAEAQALSFGVCGIVPFSSQLDQELPQALESVANGRLWVSREVWDEYVKRANKGHHILSSELRRFTPREEQVFYLLLKGFSNRKIAATLVISERTVKYHVSNILQKLHVANRRQLLVSRLAPDHEDHMSNTLPLRSKQSLPAWPISSSDCEM